MINLTADNNKKNGDKSSFYQAIMIYQSMSGYAAEGLSSFTMEGGSITNKNGDIFFVNNTSTEIKLKDADIQNEGDGIFLRTAAAGWGNEGSNGGNVSLTAESQTIEGDMLADDISTINLYLTSASQWTGAMNAEGEGGDVYVELTGGSKWTLTGDSYITSLTCDADSIDLNGHKLYVDGKEYTEGTASSGEAIVVESTGTGGSPGGAPGGAPPEGSKPPEKLE